jgi:8-oxo-dGTP diphosphatase
MKTRNVSVLVLYNKDKILLQKRGTDAKRFPNQWGLFGGGANDGEDPEETVRREIMEELDLKLQKVELIDQQKYELDITNEKGVISVFKSIYNNEKLSLNEGQRMEWVSLEDTLDYDLSPQYKNIIEKLVKTNIL